MNILRPADENATASIIKDAVRHGRRLKIQGNGSRGAFCKPVDADDVLSNAALSGITLYEPAEMIIGARAGTPVANIQQHLAEHGQMLTFEPMDHRHIMASEGEPTVGGLVAGNISGPRRISAGAARDNLVGVRFINGRGEIIKNGGRVMKNVTGLDLVRLLCGSWGTLGVLTEATFKVLPKPPSAMTLIWRGLGDEDAVRLLCSAMATPFEVSGAAHIPDYGDVKSSLTAIRIEGFDEQLANRREKLQREFSNFGGADSLSGGSHDSLWQSIQDVSALQTADGDAIWRISVQPSLGAKIVQRVRKQRGATVLYDWAGGLIWLATSEEDLAGAAFVRSAVRAVCGHATLIRGSHRLRATIDVFEPVPALLDRVVKGIKSSFDPYGVLNPGLMN